MKRLSGLNRGDMGRVKEIPAAGGMQRRLMDLGLTEGAAVECLFAAPGGGMRAYRVRKAVVALRNADAAKVYLEETGHE